jgi:hypothetical protein
MIRTYDVTLRPISQAQLGGGAVEACHLGGGPHDIGSQNIGLTTRGVRVEGLPVLCRCEGSGCLKLVGQGN